MKILPSILAVAVCGTPPEPGTFSAYPATWYAVGDSTTYCCGTSGWPAEVQRAWPGHAVTNIAVAGATTTDIRDLQWPSVSTQCNHGLFVHGGFNDISNSSDTGEQIFERLKAVADAALANGWVVAFVTPLPAGGTLGTTQEGRRLALVALERAWAADNAQPFFDLDKSLINCGIRYGDGAQALCSFAQNSGADTVHPSQGGQAAIGQYIADRLMAPALAP